MRRLAEVDTTNYGSWYLKGKSQAASRRRPIEPTEQSLAAVLKRNRRDDSGEVIDELGHSFSAWNGARDGLGISVTFGVTSAYVPNVLSLDLPDAMGDSDVAAVLDILRDAWDSHDVSIV